MQISKWFGARGLRYTLQRGGNLLRRYGLTTQRAAQRINTCLGLLLEQGCAPTLYTPGRVVEAHPEMIMRLHERGAEIGVHSYDHVDLRALPVKEAVAQLCRAAHVFEQLGLETSGFRCPYLSLSPELIAGLPHGLFRYSSNRAILWDVLPKGSAENLVFETIGRFYRPEIARPYACLPFCSGPVLEVPISIPDDLQLFDGLGMNCGQIAGVWETILHQTHARSELFCLIFHPELADCYLDALLCLLAEARHLKPGVWLATVRETADWNRELAGASLEVSADGEGARAQVRCSSRAVLLAREMNLPGSQPWHGRYCRLEGFSLNFPASERLPFLGLPAETPREMVRSLHGLGYLTMDAPETGRSALMLPSELTQPQVPLSEVVAWIEGASDPLIRLSSWPDGCASALSLSGDLDALTLWDYAARLRA